MRDQLSSQILDVNSKLQKSEMGRKVAVQYLEKYKNKEKERKSDHKMRKSAISNVS